MVKRDKKLIVFMMLFAFLCNGNQIAASDVVSGEIDFMGIADMIYDGQIPYAPKILETLNNSSISTASTIYDCSISALSATPYFLCWSGACAYKFINTYPALCTLVATAYTAKKLYNYIKKRF